MDSKLNRMCLVCGEYKPLVEFREDKRYKVGWESRCIICEKKRKTENYQKNRDRYLANGKKRHEENKERDKQKSKEYRLAHLEIIRARALKWQKDHPERVRENHRRLRLIPKVKLNHNISRRMNDSLRGAKDNQHWEDLVGYTIDQLKRHLEKQFRPGMTWDNYGSFWAIDHKTPIAVFNFENPSDIDFGLCWSLKNLQPLERRENSRKWANIKDPFQPSLTIAV